MVLGDENWVVNRLGDTIKPISPIDKQAGLTMEVNQTLEQNKNYTFLLDFYVDNSIVQIATSITSVLQPVINPSVQALSAKIIGTVLPADVQIKVSATKGTITISAYTDGDDHFVLVGIEKGAYSISIFPDPSS